MVCLDQANLNLWDDYIHNHRDDLDIICIPQNTFRTPNYQRHIKRINLKEVTRGFACDKLGKDLLRYSQRCNATILMPDWAWIHQHDPLGATCVTSSPERSFDARIFPLISDSTSLELKYQKQDTTIIQGTEDSEPKLRGAYVFHITFK